MPSPYGARASTAVADPNTAVLPGTSMAVAQARPASTGGHGSNDSAGTVSTTGTWAVPGCGEYDCTRGRFSAGARLDENSMVVAATAAAATTGLVAKLVTTPPCKAFFRFLLMQSEFHQGPEKKAIFFFFFTPSFAAATSCG